MRRKITMRELRRIRKDIINLSPFYKKERKLIITVVLPEPLDGEIQDFALSLCSELTKVNCLASISQVTFYPIADALDKDYMVACYQPLGLPTLRVFPVPSSQSRNNTIQGWINKLKLVITKRSS